MIVENLKLKKEKIALENFEKATNNLNEILDAKKSENVIYASLKRFDLCFETAFLVVKNIAKRKGLKCNSYKKFVKIMNSNIGWKFLVKDRKKSYSATDEKEAEQIYLKLNSHLKLFKQIKQMPGFCTDAGRL